MSASLPRRFARVTLCAGLMAAGIFGASRLELARFLDARSEPPAKVTVSAEPKAVSNEAEALDSLVTSLTAHDGREPGSDPKTVPRPASSKRVYGAPLDGEGTRLAVYSVDQGPEAALEAFGAELVRAGFVAVPRASEGGPMRETFTRPNVRVVVSATRTHDGPEHTLLSIVEMTAGRT
ncbi:hypothetical protein AKJ09_01426 [Labilithrix luteola]|uniref:Uncharacterized protein n=1 Tax=Labilithrix luteola TaxID=1391654 RepID=A0A0K1PMM6_9BACT|nr:hypothetical protein [Labilithrix luteola]AKU94762.1 hypothetical protein AKJ09_01426 [Labilithrix luteola]